MAVVVLSGLVSSTLLNLLAFRSTQSACVVHPRLTDDARCFADRQHPFCSDLIST